VFSFLLQVVLTAWLQKYGMSGGIWTPLDTLVVVWAKLVWTTSGFGSVFFVTFWYGHCEKLLVVRAKLVCMPQACAAFVQPAVNFCVSQSCLKKYGMSGGIWTPLETLLNSLQMVVPSLVYGAGRLFGTFTVQVLNSFCRRVPDCPLGVDLYASQHRKPQQQVDIR
jgi:hypothetical protein